MGTTGYQHTEESKQKISAAMKGRRRAKQKPEDAERAPTEYEASRKALEEAGVNVRPFDQRSQREL